MPNKKEIECLQFVAACGGTVEHEHCGLWKFCDDRIPDADTFNRCHQSGWLKTAHNFDTCWSVATLTDAGREALAASARMSI